MAQSETIHAVSADTLASDSFALNSFAPDKVKPILTADALSPLNQRSNRQGFRQLGAHLAVLLGSGYGWVYLLSHSSLWASVLALLALVIYGFSLASMFAAVHECIHRTAFASNRLNDGVAWWAGLLSFYNSTFYRRYHKWHHRYTQIAGKDPELSTPSPASWGDYLWQLSGIPWWIGKGRSHWQLAWGQFEDCPFIPEGARAETTRSVRGQLGVYVLAIGVSVVTREPWFLLYWLLPLAVGQPILRFILLAEHTHCSLDDNGLTNTRTTLTLWPLRLLMWNMPFHAEHHLYPSIPFHALPQAHGQLAQHFAHVEPGYVKVNRDIVATFGPSVG